MENKEKNILLKYLMHLEKLFYTTNFSGTVWEDQKEICLLKRIEDLRAYLGMPGSLSERDSKNTFVNL